MTLFSIDGKQQNEIGKKDHWKEFLKFNGSSLHQQLIVEIITLARESEKINSMHAGNSILSKISKIDKDLMDLYSKPELGGLFGMTLWNWLARHDEDWYFYRDSKSEDKEITGMVYFQSKD